MPAIEIVDMMKVLRIERAHTRKELKKLEKAITILRGLSSSSKPTRTGRRRKMSTSARRKIAAAQRKRWARVRASKG
jgi:hypothetical protein